MVTLTDRSQLLARHQARFAAVLYYAKRAMEEAAYEQFVESVEQFSGATGQPQGESRYAWLEENRPFSRFSPGVFRLSAEWAAPNPVGILSGDLLNSISYDMVTSSLGTFTAKTFTTGVDYTKYLLAPEGTKKMVPRLVYQHMQTWSSDRMQRLGVDIMTFQRSLL